MKVRVVVTLDVDQEAWALEYGISKKDVRADIQEYMQHGMQEWLRDRGLAVDQP